MAIIVELVFIVHVQTIPVLIWEILLNGKILACNCSLQLYTRDAAKTWKHVVSDSSGGLSLKEPSANVVLLDYIASEKWKDIVDFDDHYDDISK